MQAVANTNLRTVANFEKLHSLLIGYLGLNSESKISNDGQKQARFETNQRSDKWDVYANTEGNVSFLKYTKRANPFY